jgi:hypothetical protein
MPKISLHKVFFSPKIKQGLFSALFLKKHYTVISTLLTVYQIKDIVKRGTFA